MKGSSSYTFPKHRSKRQPLKSRLLKYFTGGFMDHNDKGTGKKVVGMSPTTITKRMRASVSTVPPLNGLNSTARHLSAPRDARFPKSISPRTPHVSTAVDSSASLVAALGRGTRRTSAKPPRGSAGSAGARLGTSASADFGGRTSATAPVHGASACGERGSRLRTAQLCLGFSEGVSRAALHCVNGAANRAPFSSLRQKPLMKRKLSSVNTNGNALCFSNSGSPLPRPVWANPLLNALAKDGVYQTALALLRKDPWYILIGWVPEKFMPPQKPGRRANGDVMLPHTRGRNASYYLQQYGAVWHVEFRVSGMTFHFQIVHRNAIAVCVRERIHLWNYYCHISSDRSVLEPILVYTCPCRHCHVATEKEELPRQRMRIIPKEPLLVDPPGTLYFKKPSLDNSASSFGNNTCVDALSAPWLVNASIVNSFPYEGIHNDLDRLLTVQAASTGFVTVVIFNIFWRDHLHNFVYSFTRKAKLKNLIVAAIDDAALETCRADRLPCLNATVFAEHEESSSPGKGFTRKVTEELSWVKPRLAIAVLRRGYGFLLADLDITWNQSPLRYLLESGVALIHQCDSKSSLSINSGFYLALPTPPVLRFFTALMTFRPDESADQNAMRLFMKYDHTHGVSHRCFPRWIFNMKCNYKRDRSVKVMNGRETFLWRPYRLDEPPSWVMMHATCLSGAKDKVRYFRTIRAWLIDDLDNRTGTSFAPKPFCVNLPHSTNDRPLILTRMWGFTPHSPFYHEMTPDGTYLLERH